MPSWLRTVLVGDAVVVVTRAALFGCRYTRPTRAFPHGGKGTIGFKTGPFGNDKVEIVLSDDGCRMSPQIHRQAFDPFFTARGREGATI